MPELRPEGLRSRPLVGYLKSLGILRVVARQIDREARARWQGGRFELASALHDDDLKRFFLEAYAPAPVVSPWNGGSGFFPNDRKDSLRAIESTSDPRLVAYRDTISAARAVLDRRGIADKPEGDSKAGLVRDLRRSLPDDALEWMDAAIVMTGLEIAYPPLLGSGGNDGRFDFSNNYARAVVALLSEEGGDRATSAALLGAALDADAVALEKKLSLAHFLRDASPVNSPAGESDSLGNPWDLVLGLEGALVLCAAATRRHGSGIESGLAAPFTVRSTAAGYGSARAGERGRAELWLPLWNGWASLQEVEALAREARAQVGRRQARTGLDFARSAGELGVARGITAFERYAILERAGKSNLAVPAGRLTVEPRPGVRAIRYLDGWLRHVFGYAGSDRSPRGVASAAKALERALFAFAESSSGQRGALVLEKLGTLESALALSASRTAGAGIRPLARAPAEEWLEAADDGTPEFAVAAAIASVRDRVGSSPRLRDYLHGTGSDQRGAAIFDPQARSLVPRRAGAVTRLAAIHARRHLDAQATSARNGTVSLGFSHALWCDPASLHAFALGRLDDERVLRLASGLCLLEFREASLPPRRRISDVPCPALDLLLLAWQGLPHTQLGPRPGWAARLAAGRPQAVLKDAALRLRLAELPPLPGATELAQGAPPGPALGAALLVQVGDHARRAMAARLGVVVPRPAKDALQPQETP